ncbi:MAG: hypothetical protein CL912_00580 [Deltaproteobacteria bacterium]|nr:hypothetical protein [Deltaproteobacteria bacterium]
MAPPSILSITWATADGKYLLCSHLGGTHSYIRPGTSCHHQSSTVIIIPDKVLPGLAVQTSLAFERLGLFSSSAGLPPGFDMSSTWSHGDDTQPGSPNRDFDDAEKGLYDSTSSLPILPPLARLDGRPQNHIDTTLSPTSPIHEGITPFSSVPMLSLSWPEGKAPKLTPIAPRKPVKECRWIRCQLWFNTYRKFFTFVTLLNLAGIIMVSLGRFPYAESHTGALVLGNLLTAVLMRNELFLRVLYIIAIYGLRSVSISENYHLMFVLY